MNSFLKKLLTRFKDNLLANIAAVLTIIMMILALSFYAPAVLRNYSSATVVIGIIACVVYAVGIFVDMKAVDVLVGSACTGFCFGYFLISRLESLNLIQVNLSDINQYFYVDIVFFALALAFSLAAAVLKKIGPAKKIASES